MANFDIDVTPPPTYELDVSDPGITQAIQSHRLDPDAHPQYLRPTAIGRQIQPYSQTLDALAALNTTPYGRQLLALADEAAARAYIQVLAGGLTAADIAAAIAAHEQETDPHPVYAKSTDLSSLSQLFAAHIAAMGSNAHIPTTGITDALIAAGAAIAWSKISKSGAAAADIGAATAAQGALAASALQPGAIGNTVQAHSATLDAIAQLSTTAFGRSLLTLADQTAAQSALGISTTGGVTSSDIAAAIAAHVAASDPHPVYATDSDLAAVAGTLSAHMAAYGAGMHVPSTGITDALIAAGAAIAWSKISKSGAAAADIGAATAAQGALAASALQPGAIGVSVQAYSSVLAAIAQISTTSFGLGFLSQPDQTAARNYIAAGSSSGTTSTFPKSSAAIPYTFSQSGVDSGYAGSYSNLTDGSYSTGAACPSASPAWFQADLGSDYYLTRVEVAGGNLSGWGTISQYWSNNQVLISSDGSTWIYLRDAGFSVISDNSLTRYVLPYCLGRYLRVQRTGYIGISTLNIYGFQ